MYEQLLGSLIGNYFDRKEMTISYVNCINYCVFYTCSVVLYAGCTLCDFVRVVRDRQDFGVFS